MAGNEKTFEQGVAVGMLLGKGADQGPKTYDLKDQLFKYILENGKIIGTCKYGNCCVKIYAGVLHFSDPNCSLFWKLDSGIRSADMKVVGYIGGTSADNFGTVTVFPEITLDEGILGYKSSIFFSENDEPLFGNVGYAYDRAYARGANLYADDGSGNGKMIAAGWWPSYLCTGLEETMNNLEYAGDFECYVYVDIKTYAGGQEEAQCTTKYRDSSGNNVSNSIPINMKYERQYINMAWQQKPAIDAEGNATTVDDLSKPPILTKGSISESSLYIGNGYFSPMPVPMMTADNITSTDIKNAVAKAFDGIYRNAEGPGGDRMTGAVAAKIFNIQE